MKGNRKKRLSFEDSRFLVASGSWFVGAVLSLFGPSGADQREAQDGCQNGQLWLGGPLVGIPWLVVRG